MKPASNPLSAVADQPRRRSLLRVGLRTVALIILYYCFSIGITFYQKWFIAGFPFPLSVVLCHLIVKYLLAALVRSCQRLWSGASRQPIAWSLSLNRTALTGVASSLDIGFSNWSFEFITVSLYTMAKTSSVIFILAFAILFGLERKRMSVVLVVCLISAGLLMFTYKSVQFNLTGFVLVIAASFLAGLRWTLAQLLMQRKETGLSSPVDMIFATQPYMIATLIPIVLLIELIPFLMRADDMLFSVPQSSSEITFCILIGSSLAFLMELSEYLLLSYTSSLTLSISSIFKEMITIGLSYQINKDYMSALNFLGFLLCMSGIVLHVYVKVKDVSSPASRAAIDLDESEVQQLMDEDEKDSVSQTQQTAKESAVTFHKAY